MNRKLHIKDKIEINKSIKAAPFKKGIRKTTPHKHNNYFEIIYLSKGSGHHFIDSRKYLVKPPVMYFVRQEQVHYWELNKEPEGFVVIIKKSFIEKSLDKELKSLFTKVSKQNSLSVKDNSTIHELFKLLTEENKTESENTFSITEGLLKALLSKVLEVAKPIINKTEIKSDLYQSFINVLSTGNTIKNKVAHYAAILNTSPQNLNAACRKAVNQASAEILAEFILSEAKRLLLYTDKTVSEISYELDFSDPSHFVKYFKRILGKTPLVFRANS
ncbi:MAG: DNA-binding protein [Bacteroidetes bacterium RIFCSPLOWO2_12_FULL_35_15]|nr:MAG: DNA-binding protein [Bacteroidetes bacterium RIFCSPLOWO2_12_FULL_35_15]